MVFQVTIEIFIRVMFRAIRRQVENLYLLFMLLQPRLNELAVVDFEIIQNKDYLLVNILDQSGHELDEDSRGHVFSVQHESDLAVIGDCRHHINPAFLGAESNDRRLTLERKSLSIVGGILDTCFVSPVDFSLFFLGFGGNCRIFFVESSLYFFTILLVSSFHRFLWSKTPPFKVIGDGPHGQDNSKLLFDGKMHCIAGPQSKGQFQLIGCFVDQHGLNIIFLRFCQLPFLSMSPAPYSGLDGFYSAFKVFLPDRATMGGGNSDHFGDRSVVPIFFLRN